MSKYDEEFRVKNQTLDEDEGETVEVIPKKRARQTRAASVDSLPLVALESPQEEFVNAESWETFAATEQEINITVYRVPDVHRGKEAFCMRCTSSSFTPDQLAEHIQENFGAGEYRVRGAISGRHGYLFVRPLTVIEKKKSLLPTLSAAPANDFQAFQSQMMEMQMAGMRAQMEMMNNLVMSLRPAAPVDPMAQMQTMMAMMVSVKEMFKPEGVTTNPLEMVKGVMEIAREMGGGGDKETNTNDVLMSLLQNAGPLLQKMAESQKVPAHPKQIQQVPLRPNPAMNPQPKNAFDMTNNGNTDIFVSDGNVTLKVAPNQNAALQAKLSAPQKHPLPEPVRRLIPALQQMMAMPGLSPEDAAQTINDAVTDDVFDMAATFIERDDAVDAFCMYVPGAAEKRDWLERVIDVLRSAWFEDGNESNESNESAEILTPTENPPIVSADMAIFDAVDDDGADVLPATS